MAICPKTTAAVIAPVNHQILLTHPNFFTHAPSVISINVLPGYNVHDLLPPPCPPNHLAWLKGTQSCTTVSQLHVCPTCEAQAHSAKKVSINIIGTHCTHALNLISKLK